MGKAWMEEICEQAEWHLHLDQFKTDGGPMLSVDGMAELMQQVRCPCSVGEAEGWNYGGARRSFLGNKILCHHSPPQVGCLLRAQNDEDVGRMRWRARSCWCSRR